MMTKCRNWQDLKIQAHKGAKGLHPGNTLAGFIKVMERGIKEIEIDVVATKDEIAVASHEPWVVLRAHDSLNNPNTLRKLESPVYALKFSELEFYRTKDMKTNSSHKIPQLIEILNVASEFKDVTCDIEIKSKSEWYKRLCPLPKTYYSIVYQSVMESNISPKMTCLRSFDWRILKTAKNAGWKGKIGLLVWMGNNDGLISNIANLGFVPDRYCPSVSLLSKFEVRLLRKCGIQVYTWGVNRKRDLVKASRSGADGVTTDFPLRLKYLHELLARSSFEIDEQSK